MVAQDISWRTVLTFDTNQAVLHTEEKVHQVTLLIWLSFDHNWLFLLFTLNFNPDSLMEAHPITAFSSPLPSQRETLCFKRKQWEGVQGGCWLFGAFLFDEFRGTFQPTAV